MKKSICHNCFVTKSEIYHFVDYMAFEEIKFYKANTALFEKQVQSSKQK